MTSVQNAGFYTRLFRTMPIGSSVGFWSARRSMRMNNYAGSEHPAVKSYTLTDECRMGREKWNGV